MMKIDIDKANFALAGKAPLQIIDWAIGQSDRALVTTNFRPYESVILHMVTQVKPDIEVLWVDSGYNTSATYRFAEKLIKSLNLNIKTYIPQQTAAYRNVVMGGIPDINTPLHEEFTRQVKLEPFQRALAELKPLLWFNAIRRDQTEFRHSLDILSYSKDGVLKVAPLFDWSEAEMDEYLTANGLPNEQDYFDPTKLLETRECGLHTLV